MAPSPHISADPTNPEHGYHCIIPECGNVAAAKVQIVNVSLMLCTKHLGELAGTATAAALRAAFTGATAAKGKPTSVDPGALWLVEDKLTEPPAAEGAWFVFNYDGNAYPEGLHTDELEARRFADSLGYHAFVVFWPNGERWHDVDPMTQRRETFRVNPQVDLPQTMKDRQAHAHEVADAIRPKETK